MDLALRLSEQEASATELRQQEEEEAMMKAIQQSVSAEPAPEVQKPSPVRDEPVNLYWNCGT